ncbi:MAG: ATP-binding cassette domain-containing protein [Actinobacteria bacterium]|nr:ATP-binding cassette domain-containing protein [Actinomycetota bacterium]
MKVELRGVTKRFPGVVANRDVNLTVSGGEVVALLGENGAGKSTLMNVLFGLYEATEGEIYIDDQKAEFSSPADAIAAGIGMVHQHFMLIPVFNVIENVMLGLEETKGMGRLDEDKASERLLSLSREHGLQVEPYAVIEDLPVGVQQRVEILKALYRNADCLILDEPTAVLTPDEIRDLIGVIQSLKDAGKAIIFISHKLKEVLEIADQIVVLRRGEVVGTTTPSETNEQELATMMVGRDVQLEVSKTPSEPGTAVLRVTDMHVRDDREVKVVNGVSFEVKAKEILAIAGVQGNGQTQLIEALTGLRKVESGNVTLGDEDVTGASPATLFKMDVAHIPEDRQADGMIGAFSIADNLVLNTYRERPFSKGILTDRSAIQRSATKLIEDFDIRTPSARSPASTLSGGNQQKMIVAREFTHAQRLLIASQPTRGLDVGSIQYIHARIVAQRDEGAGVLLVSSELDEIMALADRIAVMCAGEIVGVLDRADATREKVGRLMAGVRDEAPRPPSPPVAEGEGS